MKGFIDEFTERTDGMTAQIADLTSQLSEKDKTVEELKEELNTLGKQLSKEKIEGIKKDKTISELGKHESKLSMELMKMKNDVNAIKGALEKKGGE